MTDRCQLNGEMSERKGKGKDEFNIYCCTRAGSEETNITMANFGYSSTIDVRAYHPSHLKCL